MVSIISPQSTLSLDMIWSPRGKIAVTHTRHRFFFQAGTRLATQIPAISPDRAILPSLLFRCDGWVAGAHRREGPASRPVEPGRRFGWAGMSPIMVDIVPQGRPCRRIHETRCGLRLNRIHAISLIGAESKCTLDTQILCVGQLLICRRSRWLARGRRG